MNYRRWLIFSPESLDSIRAKELYDCERELLIAESQLEAAQEQVFKLRRRRERLSWNQPSFVSGSGDRNLNYQSQQVMEQVANQASQASPQSS